MARSPGDWRRRIAGRMPFDRAAAEHAILRAYRASGLAEPDRILWTAGPTEAADALRFIARLPRSQQRLGIFLLVAGAVLWAWLALAAVAPRTPDQPFAAIALIAAVLAYYLVRTSARRIPVPPPRRQSESPVDLLWAGALIILVMVGILCANRHLDIQLGSLSYGAAAVVSAVFGMLPGAFLLVRLRRVYRSLPDELRHLTPGKSVARTMARSRIFGRMRDRTGVRPEDSLLHAYDSAYADAFGRADDFLLQSGVILGRGSISAGMWMPPAPVRRSDPGPFRLVPPHLDGIADAELASAAEREECFGEAAFADLAYHVDRLYPFRRVVVAVLPPVTVSLDAEGRPHAEDAPALAWADGSEVYAWRGRVVDRIVLLAPVTMERINRERDRERRSVLIERYGLGRFLTENAAFNIHTDACGSLYRLDQLGEPIAAVRVVNSTAEPDGSFREFWLRVPPTMRTAREAVAWTFGLSAEEYDPAGQT